MFLVEPQDTAKYLVKVAVQNTHTINMETAPLGPSITYHIRTIPPPTAHNTRKSIPYLILKR